jgi:hypothetical protein
MTFSGGYRAPRFRDIFLAIAIMIVGLIALFQLGPVIKRIGAALFFLPNALGVVDQAGQGEVQTYTLDAMPDIVSFPAAGRYAVYTNDYDLLTVTDALREKDAPAWLTFTSAETGEVAQVTWVGRGMRLYDSHLAPGRPVFIVEITRPGFWEVQGPRRPAAVGIVRDYVAGAERRIVAVFIVELLLIAAPFLWIFGGKRWRRDAANRRVQRQLRTEADAVFRALAERRAQEQPPDADPDAAFRPKK